MTPEKWALALTILLASAIGSLADDGSNRVWIVGLTNGSVLSGWVQLPIKFAVTNNDTFEGVAVHGTNGPIIGAGATSVADYRRWMSRHGTNGPVPADTNNDDWYLFWNTQMSDNGKYAVEAELDFDGTNEPVVSVPVTVTVSNLFSFPNEVAQSFGSRMWIYTQTLPNAKVEIDIYDQTNGYLGSFFPTSDTNGVVSFLWDLTDGNGHSFTNRNFRGEFSINSLSSVYAAMPSVKPSLKLKTMPPYLKLQQKSQKPAPQVPSPANAVQFW